MLTIDNVRQLPVFYQQSIQPDQIDALGHLNVRHYVTMFDETAWHLFASFGCTLDFYREQRRGVMALRQFIQYLAEVHVTHQLSVHVRILGRSEKRIHFMMLMANDTANNVAATIEGIATFADLDSRKSAVWLPDVAAKIDEALAAHVALAWEAPLCGILKA